MYRMSIYGLERDVRRAMCDMAYGSTHTAFTFQRGRHHPQLESGSHASTRARVDGEHSSLSPMSTRQAHGLQPGQAQQKGPHSSARRQRCLLRASHRLHRSACPCPARRVGTGRDGALPSAAHSRHEPRWPTAPPRGGARRRTPAAARRTSVSRVPEAWRSGRTTWTCDRRSRQ
jgi:hypothetical protein